MYKQRIVFVSLLLIGIFISMACGVVSVSTSADPTEPAAPVLPSISAQQPAAAPPLSPTSNAPSSVVAAVQSVITRANQEQQQAIDTHNPAVMKDTATSSYYTEAAKNVNDMLSSGVTAIQLLDLSWGPINQTNSRTVQASTTETWSTTFRDGSKLQESDANVYTMVLQGNSWKVAQDDHPDSRTLQPPSSPGGTTPAAPLTPLAPAGPGQSQSRNWSGYAASGSKFTAVSGTWQVPNVSTRTEGIDATWVGIGGVSSRDLIQAGTEATVQSGQVSYSAWVETLPEASQTVPMNVSPGDFVTVSIAQQPDKTWQIFIKDSANSQTYQVNVSYKSSNSSAEWVEEAPATGHQVILPLDNFGSVTFTAATTVQNGKQLTLAQAHAQPITMSSGGRQPLALPSALAASGDSFTITRTNVPAPVQGPGGRNLSGGGNIP